METIGERLSEVIGSLNITNRKFAEAVGEHEAKISSYRRNMYKPSADTIVAIAETYRNLNIRWLLTGEGEMWREETAVDRTLKLSEQKTKIITLLTDMLVMNHELLENIAELVGTEKQILLKQIKTGFHNQ
jgi:flavorubredoxin